MADTNKLTEWQVEITATGVEAVKDATASVTASVQQQEKATEKVRDKVRQLHGDTSKLSAQMKKMWEPFSKATIVDRMKAMMPKPIKPPALAYQKDIERAQKQNARLARGIQDGSLRSLATQRHEFQRLNAEAAKLLRTDELRAKYGARVGGFLGRNEGWMRPAGAVAGLAGGAALATGTAMVHRGFSGTVEAARFDTELTLASRSLASAFKPQMEFATKAVKGFGKWLNDMSPAGQKTISTLGTVAAVGASLWGVGRMLGFSTGGILSGVGGLMGVGGIAQASIAQRMANLSQASGGPGVMVPVGRRSWMMKAAKVGGTALVANDAFIGANGGETWYQKNRRAGAGRFASAINAGGAAFGSFFTGNEYWDERIRDRAKDKGIDYKMEDQKKKDALTMAGGGFGEIGEGFDRIATSYGLRDDSMSGKDVGETLKRIEALLRGEKNADDKVPRIPPPGGAAERGAEYRRSMGWE